MAETFFAWVLVAIALVGVWLLITGVRGRRVGDDPHCRACGYNLVGAPGSPACPECGAVLGNSLSIRRGEKQRRPMRIAVGGTILSFLAALAIAVAWASFTRFNWNTIKPVWLLASEFQIAPTVTPAAKELDRRFTLGSLRQADIQHITRIILARQADTTVPWRDEWADLFEKFHAGGVVSLADWNRYVQQSVGGAKLMLRPRIRRGATVPLAILLELRGGGHPTSWFYIQQHIEDIQVDGRSILSKEGRRSFSTIYFSGQNIGLTPSRDLFTLDDLPDGEHTCTAILSLQAIDGRPPHASTPCGTTRHISRFMLVPADQPTATPIRDETQRPAIEASISLDHPMQVAWGAGSIPPKLELSFRFKNSPAPLAFLVRIRQGTREWEAGSIYASARAATSTSRTIDLPGLSDGPIDIILQPSAVTAEQTFDMTEYWDGEIVFKNVPITPRPPTATPIVQSQPASVP